MYTIVYKASCRSQNSAMCLRCGNSRSNSDLLSDRVASSIGFYSPLTYGSLAESQASGCGPVIPFFRSHAHSRMFCSNAIGTCRFKNNFQYELRQLCQAKKCVVWGDICIQGAFVLSTQRSVGGCGKGGVEATSFSLSLKLTKLVDPFFSWSLSRSFS